MPSTIVFVPVQYSRWWYANRYYTHTKMEKLLASSARLGSVSIRCSSAGLCTGVEHIHGQSKPTSLCCLFKTNRTLETPATANISSTSHRLSHVNIYHAQPCFFWFKREGPTSNSSPLPCLTVVHYCFLLQIRPGKAQTVPEITFSSRHGANVCVLTNQVNWTLWLGLGFGLGMLSVHAQDPSFTSLGFH